MLPSIFGENLFDDFFSDPFGMMVPQGRDPLYGKHAKNLMKTDVRPSQGSFRTSQGDCQTVEGDGVDHGADCAGNGINLG